MGLFGGKKKSAFGNKNMNNGDSDIVKDVENILEEGVEESPVPPMPVNSFYAADGDDLPGNDTQGAELLDKSENIEKNETITPDISNTNLNSDDFIPEEVKKETNPVIPDNKEPLLNNMGNNPYSDNIMEENNMYTGNDDYNPDYNINQEMSQNMMGGFENYGMENNIQENPYDMTDFTNKTLTPTMETPDYGINMENLNMYDGGQTYGMEDNINAFNQGMQVPEMNYGQDIQVPTMENPTIDTSNMEIKTDPVNPFGNLEQKIEPETVPNINNFATPNPFGNMENNNGFNTISKPQQMVPENPPVTPETSVPITNVFEDASPEVTPETNDGEVTINSISECRDDNIWNIFDSVYKNHPNEIKSFICANAICADKAGSISNKIVYSYIFNKDISNLESIQNILVETERYLPKGTAIYLDSEIVNNDIIPMLQSA